MFDQKAFSEVISNKNVDRNVFGLADMFAMLNETFSD